METVEVLIKLPKELYQMIKEDTLLPKNYAINEAIQNGTVLPENHGRLVDANAIDMTKSTNDGSRLNNGISVGVAYAILDAVPTIIEATKEEWDD